MFQDGFFTAAGEGLFLMIIAAILGGLIVWLLMRNRYQTLLGQYNTLTGEYGDLENRYKALTAQHDALKPKYQELQTGYEKQGRQLKECSDKRTELDMELTQVRPFKDKYEILQVDHAAKIKEHEALQTQYKSMEVRAGGLETALKEEREANMGLTGQLAILQTNKKKAESAKKTKPASPAKLATGSSQKPKKETQEEALQRIKEKASKINFDRIGVASAEDKDDLKRVKGIGPFIEKKLNAIGIYTWRQLANFIPEDEDNVNEAIEFFRGRIRRDKWSTQAAVFADEKEKQA